MTDDRTVTLPATDWMLILDAIDSDELLAQGVDRERLLTEVRQQAGVA